MAEFPEDYELIKPDDPRFETEPEERFAIYISEYISKETNIPFEKLFHHELIREYIKAKTQRVGWMESKTSYTSIRMDLYKRENELYEMITGIPVSEETLQSQRTLIHAEYDRLFKNKCSDDYDWYVGANKMRVLMDY